MQTNAVKSMVLSIAIAASIVAANCVVVPTEATLPDAWSVSTEQVDYFYPVNLPGLEEKLDEYREAMTKPPVGTAAGP